MPVTNNFKKDKDKEIEKMLGLLREVYDVIEMAHLNDHTMVTSLFAVNNKGEKYNTGFTKSLAHRIFGYLQSKDQTFRDTVIKRQNRWTRRNKRISKT